MCLFVSVLVTVFRGFGRNHFVMLRPFSPLVFVCAGRGQFAGIQLYVAYEECMIVCHRSEVCVYVLALLWLAGAG